MSVKTFDEYRAEFVRAFKELHGTSFFEFGDNGDIEWWHGHGHSLEKALDSATGLMKKARAAVEERGILAGWED